MPTSIQAQELENLFFYWSEQELENRIKLIP